MRGIVRPCRHSLGPELTTRWQAHLCGLCLTLRDTAGQAQRVLTGYDVLLLSVLVEAQAGEVRTTTAGPCALRGFATAEVVASGTGAAKLAAAGALLSAGAGLDDKVDDGDLPAAAGPAGRRVAARLARTGSVLARAVGLDPTAVLAAPERAVAAERSGGDLEALLAPTGEAVAALFAHTSVVAGTPERAPQLARAGDAFGRLVHLLDAVDDRVEDAEAGRFNPLVASATRADDARALAGRLVAEVEAALAEAELTDRTLTDVLLGSELHAAVHRALPPPDCPALPQQREPERGGTGAFAATLAALTLLVPAVFVGGSYGGGTCGSSGRRRRGFGGYPAGGGGYPPRGYDVYGYPPPRRRGYPPPQYGYRSVGPSCGQLLACNCCANLACNACCCGNSCANG